MQEQEFREEQRMETRFPAKKSTKKKWIILIAIIGAVLAGLWVFLSQAPKGSDSEITPQPEEGLIEEPSPTPTEEPIDRSQIKFEVLNGTGIAKEAAFLKEKIEEIGYSQIESGNAGDQTQTVTTVTYSASIPEEVSKEIGQLLKETYKEVKETSGETDKFDIRIITGLRQGQSLPPTAAPTSKEEEGPTPTVTVTIVPTSSPTPTP